MSFVLTLVSSPRGESLADKHINMAKGFMDEKGFRQTCAPVWLHPGKAADLGLSERPEKATLRSLRKLFEKDHIDVFINPIERRRKKLLLADMDSTIVTSETLDEIAREAGLEEKISEITRQAMEGEIDFETALLDRVRLLEGQSEKLLLRVLNRIEFNPGAKLLVRAMTYYGASCVLVTGGFSCFANPVASQAGFSAFVSNELDIRDGKLTGKIKGNIIDKNGKLKALYEFAQNNRIRPELAIAIGDGSNDVPMLKTAGLGIGYHPKPIVCEEIDNLILHGDLVSALYAQGYNEQHIRESVAGSKIAFESRFG